MPHPALHKNAERVLHMMIVGVLALHAAVCAEVAAAGGRYDVQ